jgi:hypothetical protein
VIKPGKIVDEKVEGREGIAGTVCRHDPLTSTYFPLDFFQHITQDGSSISLEPRPDNQIAVKIPASLDGCGKFKPQLIQSNNNIENVIVAMTLDNGKTYGEYIKCLEEKKYLADGKIDHGKIEGKEYSEYSYILDYSFDKTKDIKKTVKLSYGYPKAFSGNSSDSYASSFGIDKSVAVPRSLCMDAEMVAATPTLLNKGQDVLLQELTSICKNGTAQQIADARRSIGNADALKDIADKLREQLDAGYLLAVQKDVERITTAMDKLETQINAEKDTMDEKTAKTVARKYSDLARELDTLYLNPAIKHLDTLMTARAEMEDGEARDNVDSEISALNQNIGKFSSRNQTSFANLYGLMEKYALNDSAKNIEDIRLKSYVYSRVFAGSKSDKRGVPMTFVQANQKQVSILQTFQRTLDDWTDQYLVGQGNTYPLKKTEKERTAAVNKMNTRWQKYQQDEQSTYNKYCTGIFGASNPTRCSSFMAGAEQRRAGEVKKWQKDNQFVTSRNAKLERMGGNYNAYLQTSAEQRTREADNYNGFASSYSSYEDNFSDAYPMYQAPSAASSGYEAWKYSMGGQQPGMQQQGMQQQGMQQQGMQGMQGQQYQMQQQFPMQQQYNPQMQVQQGQFQMQQQPQMMGWASM